MLQVRECSAATGIDPQVPALGEWRRLAFQQIELKRFGFLQGGLAAGGIGTRALHQRTQRTQAKPFDGQQAEP